MAPPSATIRCHPYKTEYGYDAQGLRIWKKTYHWNASAGLFGLSEYRKFVYAGSNLIAEFVEDPTTGLDKLSRTYAWGQNLGGGIGGLLSITAYKADGVQVDKTYLPLYDGSGNVMGLVDAASGNVVASYEYDPFGQLLAAQGDQAALNANPFRFSTKYFDAETGLYYYGMRYYSQELGRWMTRDPLGEEGGVNVYAAFSNDPVNRIDPDGGEDISEAEISQAMEDAPVALTRAQVIEHIKSWRADQFLRSKNQPLVFESIYQTHWQYGFCAACHGSVNGDWVNLLSGFDHRAVSLEQLSAIQTANETSRELSPYAAAGLKFLTAGVGIVFIPFTGGASAIALGWFAFDDYVTGVETLRAGKAVPSLTSQGFHNWATFFGAGDEAADRVGFWGDFGSRALTAVGAWAQAGSAAAASAPRAASAPMFGSDWEAVLISRYGAENVEWVSVPQAYPLPTSLAVGSAERASARALFSEYMRYRGQGFTPAQAKYLTEPYQGMGHHFIPRRSPLPEAIVENPLNIMGRGMSRGQFYERHFLANPYFYGTKFPNRIGGVWDGAGIGLTKPMRPINWWYAAPDWLRVTGGAGAGAGAGGAAYYFTRERNEAKP